MESILNLQQNLANVVERKDLAARRAGRSPGEVRLLVVTKSQPVERIEQVIAAGAGIWGESVCLGENYVDEAVEKIEALKGRPGIEWHMIGHVQSRKARAVCESFQYLHSLDSLKLAQRLDRFAAELSQTLPVLLECNVSGEETKFGYSAWEEESWPALFPEIGEIAALPNLRVHGLMTMAPYGSEPETARPYFSRLRRLRDRLARQFPQAAWDELSMGMSADFEVAIEEGATWIRVGQAILPRV